MEPGFHSSILVFVGNTYVYLVNHPPFNEHPPADTVEKFLLDVENGILTHQKTFSDPEFIGFVFECSCNALSVKTVTT